MGSKCNFIGLHSMANIFAMLCQWMLKMLAGSQSKFSHYVKFYSPMKTAIHNTLVAICEH